MTRKELSEQYDVSENSIKSKFPYVQQKFLNKYHLVLTRTGKGDKADYQVRPTEGDRAQTMYLEKNRQVMIAESEFSNLVDFNFMVFLAICSTERTVFYGSYEDFLDYVEIKKTKANIQSLKEALEFLYEKDYIRYEIDKTNSDYFVAYLFFTVRQKMAISLDMTTRCKELAKKSNKRTWVPLLKTWIGIQYMYDNQPFTMKQLCALTGLSEYQVRDCKKVLEQDNLFVTSKAYVNYNTCIGSNVALNGIIKENRDYVESHAKTAKNG